MGDQVNVNHDYFFEHVSNRLSMSTFNQFFCGVSHIDSRYGLIFSDKNRINRGYGQYFPVGGLTVDIGINRIFP